MMKQLILLLLLMNGPLASAKVYKWVDEKGVTHYSENKPENAGFSELKVKNLNTEDSVLNCEQAVKNASKIEEDHYLETDYMDELDEFADYSDSILYYCLEHRSDPKKAAIWLCQQRAKSYLELETCRKAWNKVDFGAN